MTGVLEHILPVCILFFSFLLTIVALLELRYSPKASVLVAGGFLLGILALQGGLLLTGQDAMLVLTLLPLTAYLPAIICVHILSSTGFFQTCAVWTAGLLVSFTLTFGRKLLVTRVSLSGLAYSFLVNALLLVLAAVLVVVIFKVVRIPFREYVGTSRGGWLSMTLPMLVIFALLSYFSDSTTHPTALVLIFLTALVVVFTLARSLVFSVTARRNREAEEAVKHQLDLQRQDYEVLNHKLELGRTYRHDLRHHLGALEALLRQGQAAEAADYIDRLGGQVDQLEQERWCANPTLNAVLCASIGTARQAGCEIDADIRLPAELPFNELDLCVILSNALENAVHACEVIPTPRRKICVEAALTDGRRLTVSVQNPWDEPVSFDDDGFPIVPPREGHGIGLRSVEAVTRKYNGIFHCSWSEGMFTLKTVLFDAAEAPKDPGEQRPRHRAAAAVLTSVFLCVFFLNCMPTLARALEDIPVVGTLVRIVDLRTWSARWGDTSIEIEAPVAEGDGAEDLNAQADEWTQMLEEKFLWHVSRKFEGYVGLDSFHNTLRDDERYLTLRFSATVNAGGSVDYVRFLTLDKQSGQILTLGDLFAPDSEYISALSENVRVQMEEQMNAGEGDYFLPGYGWPVEDCFTSIDPDMNFYLDDENNLVLLFEEYTVAPGSMGAPQFKISLKTLSHILA